MSILSSTWRETSLLGESRLFDDVRTSIDDAHADGAVHRTIAADFPTYIHRDPGLARTLHKLRSAGKKLFLLTNGGASQDDANKHQQGLLGNSPRYFSHYGCSSASC